MGRLSDAHGRKPFLLLSFLCSGAQAVAMLLYLRCGVSLLWFFPAQVRWPAPGPRMLAGCWHAACGLADLFGVCPASAALAARHSAEECMRDRHAQ